MEGPMQNLDLYNLEILADQIFSVVCLSLFFQNFTQDNCC